MRTDGLRKRVIRRKVKLVPPSCKENKMVIWVAELD